jgi:putative ABC transport system substrate-binding protein
VKTRLSWLVSLALAIATLPPCPVLLAQEPGPRSAGKVAHIGILGYGVDDSMLEVFRRGMLEFGRVEKRDYVLEYRASEGRVEDLAGRANELVGLHVDVILASGTPSVRAAQKATTTIPVVMVSVGLDPVRLGLVQSLGRPGGNVTGVAALGVELLAKRLQLFHELIPALSRVGVLLNPSNPANVLSLREFRTAASAARITVEPVVEAKTSGEIPSALRELAAAKPEGMYIVWDAMLQAHAKGIAEFAFEQRIPTLAAIKEHVEAGALMSYGAKLPDQWRRLAHFVDRILNGATPATLPVEQPIAFELVINRKTAKALGLTIPPELLLLADKVIE